MVTHLEGIWQQPDHGIWETRSGPKHFTYSKVMAWVAFDRAIKIAQKGHFKAPVDRWKKLRTQIHDEICAKAFDERLNSFVQSYGAQELDASALLMSMVGFLPVEDPRIKGTIEAIEGHLMEDGLVKRYDTRSTDDGVGGHEGNFLACSFWLVNNLWMLGKHKEATKLFERLLALSNDLGLFAEEYDTRLQRQVGNFPQAFSHISLIGTAYQLTQSQHLQRHHTEQSAPGPDLA